MTQQEAEELARFINERSGDRYLAVATGPDGWVALVDRVTGEAPPPVADPAEYVALMNTLQAHASRPSTPAQAELRRVLRIWLTMRKPTPAETGGGADNDEPEERWWEK